MQLVAARHAEVRSSKAVVAILLVAFVAVNVCNSSKAAGTLVLDGCNTKLFLVGQACIASVADAPVSEVNWAMEFLTLIAQMWFIGAEANDTLGS